MNLVMQAAFYCLKQTSALKYLNDMDVFSLLIAALCHDVGHTGRTNLFEIGVMSKLAIRYNDKSVKYL